MWYVRCMNQAGKPVHLDAVDLGHALVQAEARHEPACLCL